MTLFTLYYSTITSTMTLFTLYYYVVIQPQLLRVALKAITPKACLVEPISVPLHVTDTEMPVAV